MECRDPLTEAFSQYLENNLTLLQIISQIIVSKFKTDVCLLGKDSQGKQIADNQLYRDIQVGISRVKYYQKKLKDINTAEVDLDFVKTAGDELDTLLDIVKEYMKTLE